MSDRTRNPSMGRDNRGKGRGGRGVGRVKMADREIEELEAAIKVRGATQRASRRPKNLAAANNRCPPASSLTPQPPFPHS